MNRDWKSIMDYIFELEEDLAVIMGVSDITIYNNQFYFKDLKSNNFWMLTGRGDNDSILESLLEFECSVDREGEYEFKAILKYINGDYSTGENGYWEVKHIEFKFIQTFKEREREFKINELFDIF